MAGPDSSAYGSVSSAPPSSNSGRRVRNCTRKRSPAVTSGPELRAAATSAGSVFQLGRFSIRQENAREASTTATTAAMPNATAIVTEPARDDCEGDVLRIITAAAIAPAVPIASTLLAATLNNGCWPATVQMLLPRDNSSPAATRTSSADENLDGWRKLRSPRSRGLRTKMPRLSSRPGISETTQSGIHAGGRSVQIAMTMLPNAPAATMRSNRRVDAASRPPRHASATTPRTPASTASMTPLC